ncbi:MFS transporter [Bradyrhizobium sp. STM 3557]|uniref:MFS transporter n=1 Tax=Bradyrhizobium sp. STM 3557 TaxID=578920 RepID=UPI00388FE9E4
MAFIDSSVVNVALPAIQRDLGAGAGTTQWFANAYLLMLGALVLIGGSAADHYGRRRVFISGVIVFALASVACGLAPNAPALVVSRAAQGCGAALLTPASLAMLGAAFGEADRNRAIGLWAGFGALTSAIGPVLGGWLVDQLSWRAIFLINIPLAAGAVVFAALFACESRDPHKGRLDWPGAVSIAAALASFAWALGAIPASGMSDIRVMASLLFGACALAAFLVVEAKAGIEAMMPLSFFRSRDFSGTNALTLLLYFALGGLMYFLPFGLIRIGGYTATQAGAALLPLALMLGFGSTFAGMLADRYGARLMLSGGPLLAAPGFAMLGFADLSAPYDAAVLPAVLVMGAGMTITVAPLTATVMTALGDEHAGVASGVNNAVARIAGLLAVAILGAVLFASFRSDLNSADRAAAAGALGAVMSGRADDIDLHAIDAFAFAFRTVMFASGASAALGALVARLTITVASGSPKPSA